MCHGPDACIFAPICRGMSWACMQKIRRMEIITIVNPESVSHIFIFIVVAGVVDARWITLHDDREPPIWRSVPFWRRRGDWRKEFRIWPCEHEPFGALCFIWVGKVSAHKVNICESFVNESVRVSSCVRLQHQRQFAVCSCHQNEYDVRSVFVWLI